ncbi:hypothetical protein [Bacillus swezeyi]|uniref:hypothetical protein n=1 Tax=Bacillus swezeyi TaxID=1925020 RepID=UPI003F8A5086
MLKIIHILLASMFFGGIMSSLALHFAVNMTAYEETFYVVIISDHTIRIGAVGTLLIGFIYEILTKWGFFKHRWITEMGAFHHPDVHGDIHCRSIDDVKYGHA